MKCTWVYLGCQVNTALFGREQLNRFCHIDMKESSDSEGFYFCFCIVDADSTSKECDIYFDINIIYDV